MKIAQKQKQNHFVKDYIKQHKIKIEWVNSAKQRADIFTKVILTGDKFKENRDTLIANLNWEHMR